MNREGVATGPLRAILIGAALCLADLPVELATAPRIPVWARLVDLAGLALIGAGVFGLSRVRLTPAYGRVMRFALAVAAMSAPLAAANAAIADPPPSWILVRTAFELAQFAALPLFCLAMRLLCDCRGRERAAASWTLTAWMFLWLNAIPFAVYSLSSAAYAAEQNRVHVHLGMGQVGLIFFPVSALPLIGFLVATRRMGARLEVLQGEEA